MLKIRRTANGHVVFTLSGRIEAEDVEELKQLLSLEMTNHQVALDLRDVTLVNQEAVKFLARCEADSIKLKIAPPIFESGSNKKQVEPVAVRTTKTHLFPRAHARPRIS